MYSQRINNLQKKLQQNQVWLISDQNDIRYLTGFVTLTSSEREAFVVISHQKAYLLLSSFSKNQPVKGLTQLYLSSSKSLGFHLSRLVSQQQTLHIDAQSLFVNELNQIQKFISTDQIQGSKPNPVTNLRMIKDSAEIAAIRKVSQITSQALNKTLHSLKIGMTEKEVSETLELKFYHAGARQLSFPTIVAFGPHTALPHHQPTTQKLKNNQPILIDCGAKLDGYCTDMTRTIWFGDDINPEFTKIEKAVQKAYKKTVAKLQNGKAIKRPDSPPVKIEKIKKQNCPQPIFAKNLDSVARTTIKEAGYGTNFIHTTGHGLGLYIHEPPSLNWKNEQVIKPGMIITIEPGIYLEGKFGYRHENTILVAESGCEELTK